MHVGKDNFAPEAPAHLHGHSVAARCSRALTGLGNEAGVHPAPLSWAAGSQALPPTSIIFNLQHEPWADLAPGRERELLARPADPLGMRTLIQAAMQRNHELRAGVWLASGAGRRHKSLPPNPCP